MKPYPYSLSIVMPVFNEAEVIASVVDDFAAVAEKFERSEFIIVNDKSTDATLSILEKLKTRYPFLRIIIHKKNKGHGPALFLAFQKAKGDFIFHCDSDNQFKAQDFWLLWEEMRLHDKDLVIGYRAKRNDPFARLVLTRLTRFFIFLISGYWLYDSNSPFRLWKRQPLNSVLPLIPAHPLVPSILMLMVARKLGFDIGWVRVIHLPRLTGKSFFRSWKIFKICFPAVKEVLLFRLILLRL